MKLLRVGLPIAALLLGSASVEASTVGVQGVPQLDVYWQNGTVPGAPIRTAGSIQLAVDEEGNFAAFNQTFTWGLGAEQDTITLQLASGNLDPFLNFAVGFVDSGAASIFTVVFSSPIAPTITGLANYTLDLAGSFSNGSPNNGGSLAMAAPNTLGVLEAQLNGTSIDGIGTAASFAALVSSVYGPFGSSGTFDCSGLGGCTTMSTRLAFLGSGGSDAYSYTGRFEITAVPVPAAVWLFGSALGLMGVMRRKLAS